MLIGFGCYCLLVWSKTLRFRELLSLAIRVHQLFPILALHTFWGNLLPMRTGDVSYVYLMQRRQQVEATQGIASLLVASVIDLVLLISLMVSTAWLLRPKLSGRFSWAFLYLMPLLMGVCLVVVLLFACLAPNFCSAIANKGAAVLLRVSSRFPSPVPSLLCWAINKGLEVIQEFTVVRFNARFLRVWGYSVVCLAIRFGFQCYLVAEMGVNIPLTEVLFALAFTNGFNLLPIQTVGNFGTTEFPFTFLLSHFGIPKEIGTVTGFSLHIIILLYCLPLGAYGFLSSIRRRGR